MAKHLCAECIHKEVCEYQTSEHSPTTQCDDYTTKTNIENAILIKMFNELKDTRTMWPEDLEDIFYKYIAERNLDNG